MFFGVQTSGVSALLIIFPGLYLTDLLSCFSRHRVYEHVKTPATRDGLTPERRQDHHFKSVLRPPAPWAAGDIDPPLLDSLLKSFLLSR